MTNSIETYEILWQDIPITLTYQAEWLGLCAHLQFKAGERLPITETGYKSIYLSAQAVVEAGGTIAFATGLLDESAESAEWKDYCQERQQLCLF